MSRRTEQVGHEIQRILSQVLEFDLKDPRVGFATITSVNVTPDMQRANVNVSVMGDDAERRESLRALERAKGFLRRRIGEELSLRQVPELKLHLDTSLDHALRIGELLNDVEEERRRNPPNLEENDEAES
jgi:ribosome-binding factor A